MSSIASKRSENLNPIFRPSIINAPILKDIPPINYDRSKLKFSGSSSVDNFPTIIKGVSIPNGKKKPWFKGKGLCVTLETYGGGGEIGGDLACLFHSTCKSILPELSHVEYNSKNKKEYAKECYRICHNFKASLAAFCLSDTNEDHTYIKFKHTIANADNFSTFYNRFISNSEIQNINLFKERLLNAITERNSYINEQKELMRLRGEDTIRDKIAKIREKLLSPDLDYNILLSSLEKYYLDPRYKATEREGKHYYWSQEIRKLPLSTGLFGIMDVFENPEWDIREEEVGGKNAPLFGTINLDTFTDQLLSRKMYGVDFFRLIASVTGFNIFMLTPEGDPHYLKCVSPIPTNVDIVSLVLQKMMNDKWQYLGNYYDEEAPCIVISYAGAHFESIALLHEVKVEGAERPILQAQTVFSCKDPFIQAIIAKNIQMQIKGGQKVEGVVEEKEEIDFESMNTDDVIKYLDSTSNKNWRIGMDDKEARSYARKFRNDMITPDIPKASAPFVEEKKEEIDFEDMDTDDVIKYLDSTTDGNWRAAVEDDQIRSYARNFRKNRLKEKTSKTQEDTINFKNMDTDGVIKYLDSNKKGWRNDIKDIRSYAREYKKSSLGDRSDQLSEMDTDEAMAYLDATTPEWKNLLEEDSKPRDYARQIVKQAN